MSDKLNRNGTVIALALLGGLVFVPIEGIGLPQSPQERNPNVQQHRDPSRVAKLVNEAKAQGKNEVVLSPPFEGDEPGGNISLDTALEHYSVIIAEVTRAQSVLESDTVRTWYRLNVLDVLHQVPYSLPYSVTPPQSIMPAQSSELLVRRGKRPAA